MEEFNKGLYVTLFGMGLVFLSLAIIMFAIWGMERIFRQKEEKEEAAPEVVVSDPRLAEGDEVAAAIAVALALASEEERQAERGKWLTVASANGSANPWTAQGRQILMSSRNITRVARRK